MDMSVPPGDLRNGGHRAVNESVLLFDGTGDTGPPLVAAGALKPSRIVGVAGTFLVDASGPTSGANDLRKWQLHHDRLRASLPHLRAEEMATGIADTIATTGLAHCCRHEGLPFCRSLGKQKNAWLTAPERAENPA